LPINKKFRGRPRREPAPDINRRLLRFDEVRLVGADGRQLGVFPTQKALEQAESEGLDLVLIAANAVPPVCRIADYGKFKYEQSKAKKANRRVVSELKGITMRPGIAVHDLGIIIRKAKGFLEDGHKVRVVCRFRPRELGHPELGMDKMKAIAEGVQEVGKMDRDPLLQGREMSMLLNPKASPGAKKDGKGQAEDEQDGDEAV
jgi:translation initiation factor IF-3